MPTCSVNAGSLPEFRSQLNRLGQRKHKCKPRQITKNCCYSSIPTHWISEHKLSPKILWVKTRIANPLANSISICLTFRAAGPHLRLILMYQAGGPLSLWLCVCVCVFLFEHTYCTLQIHHVKGSTCFADLVRITTSHSGFFLNKQRRRAGRQGPYRIFQAKFNQQPLNADRQLSVLAWGAISSILRTDSIIASYSWLLWNNDPLLPWCAEHMGRK